MVSIKTTLMRSVSFYSLKNNRHTFSPSRIQMNVNPTPALAVVVDLQTLLPETFSFA